MVTVSKSSHVGSASSIVEILVTLYFKILNIDPLSPEKEDRNRFILSKGHASAALYATLYEQSFFSKDLLDKYYIDGSLLGHLDSSRTLGVEVSTGSLGHELSIGIGMAIAPNSVRDFIFMDYRKVIETSDIGGEIFNIGYGEQHSVGEVVNMIVELTGNNVRPEWGSVPKRAIEPNVWQADVTKAKNVLKWEPKYSLEKGLAKTVKWFMENMILYDKQQKEDRIR